MDNTSIVPNGAYSGAADIGRIRPLKVFSPRRKRILDAALEVIKSIPERQEFTIRGLLDRNRQFKRKEFYSTLSYFIARLVEIRAIEVTKKAEKDSNGFYKAGCNYRVLNKDLINITSRVRSDIRSDIDEDNADDTPVPTGELRRVSWDRKRIIEESIEKIRQIPEGTEFTSRQILDLLRIKMDSRTFFNALNSLYKTLLRKGAIQVVRHAEKDEHSKFYTSGVVYRLVNRSLVSHTFRVSRASLVSRASPTYRDTSKAPSATQEIVETDDRGVITSVTGGEIARVQEALDYLRTALEILTGKPLQSEPPAPVTLDAVPTDALLNELRNRAK